MCHRPQLRQGGSYRIPQLLDTWDGGGVSYKVFKYLSIYMHGVFGLQARGLSQMCAVAGHEIHDS